ncbi:hypothetical protein ACS0TY_021278 [Phlomoides rotata]
MGFVFRNSVGEVILAGAKRCVATKENNTIIEALALRFGVQCSMKRGLKGLILEADSCNLILALKGELEADTTSMMIVGDIWEMARIINCPSFNFVGRSANRVAHSLAHYGNRVGFENLWISEIPACCNGFVLDDLGREPI